MEDGEDYYDEDDEEYYDDDDEYYEDEEDTPGGIIGIIDPFVPSTFKPLLRMIS